MGRTGAWFNGRSAGVVRNGGVVRKGAGRREGRGVGAGAAGGAARPGPGSGRVWGRCGPGVAGPG